MATGMGRALPEMEPADVFNLLSTVDGTVVVCGAILPAAGAGAGAGAGNDKAVTIDSAVYLPAPLNAGRKMASSATEGLNQVAPGLLKPPIATVGLTGGYVRQTSQIVIIAVDDPSK